MRTQPSVNIIHDTRRFLKGTNPPKAPIRLRIIFKVDDLSGNVKRIHKYYGDGMYCTVKEFAKLSTPATDTMRQMMKDIHALYSKAMGIIGSMNDEELTVALFESRFFGIALDTMDGAYNKIIESLRKDDRIGTARSYRTALNSFKGYALHIARARANDSHAYTAEENEAAIQIRFSEVDPDWLAGYEKWMLRADKSINSVGINMRSLRAVFNSNIKEKVIPATMYPFKSFKIKSERKFKVPLNDREMELIKGYQSDDPDRVEAIDFWKFSYYCNGMNMVDVAKLRHSDIQDEFLIYDRTKTRRTKIQFKKIIIPIDHEIMDIIRRRGARTLDPNAYIFPVLEDGLTPLTVKNRVQKFIKRINAGLKKIKNDLEIKKQLTTVIARHTYANRMMNGGTDRRIIQEALGHQIAQTTEHYLGSMDLEKIKSARKAL